MHVPKYLTTLFVAGAFAACESAIELTAPVSTAQFARSSTAPVAQVSAGGKLDLSGLGLPPETYGLTASVDGDGNAKGQVTAKFISPLVEFRVEISCLSVSGNQAWLGGIVTHTHDADIFPVGTGFRWRMVDNGEGKTAPRPDQLSAFSRRGDPSRCTDQGDFPPQLFDWLHGNIQIKGSTD